MPMGGDGGEGSGKRDGGGREGRKISRRISELMGKFGEGGGSEEEGTLVRLDAGNNKLCGKKIIAKR